MKVCIFGKGSEAVENLVKKFSFEVVNDDPDFVISYGGDGTLVASEAVFPGVPKIALRNSVICKKCQDIPNEEILKRVSSGNYTLEEFLKLEVSVGNKKMLGLNEIVVHNSDPRHAIRYKLSVNDSPFGGEIIGDGIVVATPSFGSTGYYRSITDSFFEVGIGLAFNNSIEQSDHVVLKEDSKINIKILRGPATVYVDNQKETFVLEAGDEARVEKSKETAKIVRV